MRQVLAAFICSLAITNSGSASEVPVMTKAAEQYVHLVLAMGVHDPDYVDAYYGPSEWKITAEKEKKPLDQIAAEATQLRLSLEKVTPPNDQMEQLRLAYLTKQLAAMTTRVRVLKGEKLKFDQEAHDIYDVVAPAYPDLHFDQIVSKLGKKLPGSGALSERYQAWHKAFVIPKEKLDPVFQLAIKECRARTLAQVKLPPDESFTVEYVTGKPWGGYNWYKGNYHSVIQVNTDLPIYIDRAIDLAAHEGYPGHHVYNALLEKNLAHDRGWIEFSVYPLFSPQSLIAEGTANFGREVVLTKAERTRFEKEVLWPAAGIDASRYDEFCAVESMVKELDYAANEAARRLINGEISPSAAASWLQKYALLDKDRAEHRVQFIERYRSYVINYNVGEAMVRHYIEKRGGTDADPEKRWQIFADLLSSPRLPGALSRN